MIVLLVFLGLGGVALAVCCGGMFYFGKQAADAVTEDPTRINEIRGEIATIQLPEAFKPKAGMDFGMFGVEMRMVMYVYENEQTGTLMLMQMAAPEGSNVDQNQMEAQMNQQGQGQSELTNITDETTKKYTIGGKEVDFHFRTGEVNGVKYREVQGLIPGANASSFRQLTIQIQQEKFDEAMIDGIINSIQ